MAYGDVRRKMQRAARNSLVVVDQFLTKIFDLFFFPAKFNLKQSISGFFLNHYINEDWWFYLHHFECIVNLI